MCPDNFFYILLPLVAFLYASVGHGGASGYLALMAIFGFSISQMRPTVLILNLFVAGVSFYNYHRANHFKWSLFYPFAITSIPFAFLGGTISLNISIYKQLLAVLLILSVLRLLGLLGAEEKNTKNIKLWQGLLIGALIGLFSGMIGIGGGIILSPVILLFGWGKIKHTAAVSALFIWVNSAAALLGNFSGGQFSIDEKTPIFLFLTVAGGFFGGYFGSKKFSNKKLNYLLAFVLVIASTKLLLT
ncbi:MAG: sulfite exporter TauE/SafE family protein [Flavobacteriales bacterium]|nr:sulfite exporter TauE/SafE family protein [Flavobacteriales bacterium]